MNVAYFNNLQTVAFMGCRKAAGYWRIVPAAALAYKPSTSLDQSTLIWFHGMPLKMHSSFPDHRMPLSSWRKRESETQRGKWGRSDVPPMLTMFSCRQKRIPPGRPCKQCTPSLNHIHTLGDLLGSLSLPPSVWGLRQCGQLAIVFFIWRFCQLLCLFLCFGFLAFSAVSH